MRLIYFGADAPGPKAQGAWGHGLGPLWTPPRAFLLADVVVTILSSSRRPSGAGQVRLSEFDDPTRSGPAVIIHVFLRVR